MTDYKPTNSQLVAPDQPVDPLTYDRLSDASEWLLERRGNAVTLTFAAKSTDPTDYIGERPYVSTSGFASIVHIPWWIDPRIETLRISMLCRVSNGQLDGGGGTPPSRDWVNVRAGFLANEDYTQIEVSPYDPLGEYNTPAEWQWVTMDYQLGDWLGGLGRGAFYDTLSISIRSEVGSTMQQDGYLTSADVTGYLDQDGLNGADAQPYYVRASTDLTFFAEGSTTAPAAGCNEASALIIGDAPAATVDDLLGPYDMVMRRDDESAYIWPWTDAVAGSSKANQIFRMPAAYIQFRSITITEIMSVED